MLISTDASIFEIEPKEVIFPVDREDLINIIRRLLSENESFTMRAGGRVVNVENDSILAYNTKDSLLNPHFIVHSD